MSPAPPHFAQFLPSLAASTQQACVQVLPSALALAQQPATLDSAFLSPSAAKAKPAATNAITTNARNDLRLFIYFWFGGLQLIGAGGGSRTRFSCLGSTHNSRYTTPAVCRTRGILGWWRTPPQVKLRATH